jgi:hypothetical protein
MISQSVRKHRVVVRRNENSCRDMSRILKQTRTVVKLSGLRPGGDSTGTSAAACSRETKLYNPHGTRGGTVGEAANPTQICMREEREEVRATFVALSNRRRIHAEGNVKLRTNLQFEMLLADYIQECTARTQKLEFVSCNHATRARDRDQAQRHSACSFRRAGIPVSSVNCTSVRQ